MAVRALAGRGVAAAAVVFGIARRRCHRGRCRRGLALRVRLTLVHEPITPVQTPAPASLSMFFVITIINSTCTIQAWNQ